MQLCEAGLLDLDAPATTYLRAYPLVGNPRWQPVTVRHLLTHTSGIPDVIHLADLLHPGWGSFGSRPAAASVPSGAAIPPLAEVYRSGLRSVVEPGTTFAYTNHGVATLGQIVEDVTGTSLDRYLEDRVFRPLGMLATHLGPAGTGDEPRAVGYEIGSRGPTPAPEREWVTLGASGAVSTTRDMGRFVAALIGGGANEHGSVLQPATLATMFAPQFRSDPRVPGIGLAFFRSELGGHRVVGHDGRLPGFNAQLVVAPDDGVGVVAFTNGSRGATSWLPLEMEGLLRDLLGVRSEAPRTDIAARPEVWPEICGRYALPQRIGDFRGRMLMGGGVEILVQDGRLMARLRVPAPALWRGLPLLPVKASDPYLFRLDLAPFGMPSTLVAFTPEALHTDLACLTLVKRAAKAGSRRREQRALSGPRAHPEADRLTADDRLILSVDAAWPQDVGALAILDGQRLLDADGSVRIEAVREAIACPPSPRPALPPARPHAAEAARRPVVGGRASFRPRRSRARASPSPREWGSGASRRSGGAPAAATRPPAPVVGDVAAAGPRGRASRPLHADAPRHRRRPRGHDDRCRLPRSARRSAACTRGAVAARSPAVRAGAPARRSRAAPAGAAEPAYRAFAVPWLWCGAWSARSPRCASFSPSGRAPIRA